MTIATREHALRPTIYARSSDLLADAGRSTIAGQPLPDAARPRTFPTLCAESARDGIEQILAGPAACRFR
jgi:hypothetical protein